MKLRWLPALLAAACASPAAPPPGPAAPPPSREAVALLLQVGDGPPRRWDSAELLAYAFVAAADGRADPGRPLFTDFVLVLPAVGARTLDDAPNRTPAERGDWMAALDVLFDHAGTATAALEDLGRRTDTSFRVWVSLPYPSRRQEAWGPQDGRMLDFRRLADRKRALEDWVERAEARWATLPRRHLKLVGYLWSPPAMWETTGTRHWEDAADDRKELNTDENLAAWLHGVLGERGRELIWRPDYHRYILQGGDPHQHGSPWATHAETGEPLFDRIYFGPDASSAELDVHLNAVATELLMNRGVGVSYAPGAMAALGRRETLDALPALFSVPESGPEAARRREIYETTVRIVERRRGRR
jgi:hypothetical protein